MSILKLIHLNNTHNAIKDAWSLQMACAQVGFDWDNVVPVYNKITEELEEVAEACENPQKTKEDVAEELGDLIFACINLARHLDVDPTLSLRAANRKFKARFEEIEKIKAAQGGKLTDTSAAEYEQLWQEVKNKAI